MAEHGAETVKGGPGGTRTTRDGRVHVMGICQQLDLDKQNNNFARALLFFLDISLPSFRVFAAVAVVIA